MFLLRDKPYSIKRPQYFLETVSIISFKMIVFVVFDVSAKVNRRFNLFYFVIRS